MRGTGIKNSSSYQEKCVNCNQTFTSKSAYINHEKSCKLNIIQTKRKNSQFKTTKIGFFKSSNTIVQEIDSQISTEYFQENEFNQINMDNISEWNSDLLITNKQDDINSYNSYQSNAHQQFSQIIVKHQLHEDAINDVISLITNVTNKDPKELGIPNNAKEALKFIDLIGDNLSQDWFETETIMYNDQQYILRHRNIIACIKEMLNGEYGNTCQFFYKEELDKFGNQLYSDPCTADWFKQTQYNSKNSKSGIIGLILYSDATICDTLGKIQKHPIFVSLCNFPNNIRNKENAKVLLGYIPIINNANVEVYLQNYHKSIEILLHPLLSQYNSGAWITVNGEPKHFYIFLSYGISDMKEANNACAAYQSYNALFPCYSCLVPRECLSSTDHNLIFPGRFTHNIRSYFMDNSLQEKDLKNELHKLSLHPIKNSFWNHKNFEVYTSFVPDIMHVCDLGLFVYMINFTMEKLEKESQSEKKIKFLNNRLSSIPRYYKLLLPSKGINNRTNFTANDWRNIMKVFIFAINGLIDDKQTNDHIVECFQKWNEFYLLLRSSGFTENCLNDLSQKIYDWANIFSFLFKSHSKSGLQLPKLHSLLHHIIPSIKKFGAPTGFSTETYESLHKKFVKQPYRSSNKRNPEIQMIKLAKKIKATKNTQYDYNTLITKPLYSFTMSNKPNFNCKEYSLAMQQLDSCLNNFKNMYNVDNIFNQFSYSNTRIYIYNSANHSSGVRIHAASEFHQKPWFSDVEITMDIDYQGNYEATYWGKVLCLVKLLNLEFALIQWYDYFENIPDNSKFGCPYLKLENHYDLIPISSISNVVHIIPDFNVNNGYFINKYIF
ncbi:hypothetical protein RclHR1_14330004 [Rhizophagus clarus]|uniref:C2H2-type domain-containing protein n=1 Tax=Rhizophagus clarus TaxID=94130 RepID=A0A2Z6QGR0_9GLOM|nr:hypothetical protein RclHR1_14330004 [Rhizophagus clarus]